MAILCIEEFDSTYNMLTFICDLVMVAQTFADQLQFSMNWAIAPQRGRSGIATPTGMERTSIVPGLQPLPVSSNKEFHTYKIFMLTVIFPMAKVTSTSTLPPNTDAGTITGTYTPTSTGSFSSARPTDSPPSSDSGGSSLSAGAIAGIVVGSVAGILILISLLFRRKILACFGYRKADQSVYSPVYPLQTPTTQFSPEVGNISQPQSPPPWDKPELAGHVQPTAPVRVTPHEME